MASILTFFSALPRALENQTLMFQDHDLQADIVSACFTNQKTHDTLVARMSNMCRAAPGSYQKLSQFIMVHSKLSNVVATNARIF
jgi:hypothetical protein